MPEEILTKRCSLCHEEKPLEDFPRHRKTKSGRYCQCRLCVSFKTVPPEVRLRRIAAINKWNSSDKGRASRVRTALKWSQSVKGKTTLLRKRRRARFDPARREKRSIVQKLYRQSPKRRERERQRICDQRHHERLSARKALRNAVSLGKIVRASTCEKCGANGPTQSHHHLGYSREHWFDVEWLCHPCHVLVHYP